MPDKRLAPTHASSVSPVGLWLTLWRDLSVPDRRRLKIAAGVMLAASGLTAILPVLIGGLVDKILHGHTITLAGAAGPLAEIAALAVAGQMLQVIRRQLVETVATGFERDSRERAYGHLIRLDLDRLRHDQHGRIYGRANRSIEGAVRLIKLGAMDLLPAATLAVSAIIVVFTRNPLVAAAMVMVIPTGFALVAWQVHNQQGVRLRIRDHKEAIDAEVNEMLPALEVVRAAGADRQFLQRIAENCARLRTTELRHHITMSFFDAAKALNEAAWMIVTLGVAVQLTASGKISAGELTAYFLLYVGVTTPLRELHRIVDEAAESSQQTTDLLGMYAEPEDASYRARPVPGPTPVAGEATPAIAISDVTFTHLGKKEPILDGLSLRIAAGERIGIVGASNCGKSTLLKLIARLHHLQAGTIRIDGRDVRDIPRGELVEQVGYVAQRATLFRETVRWNISLGHPGVSNDEIVQAARRAQIHEDILAMPGGYDAVVGEQGGTLSGGQCQRLCLARALVHTPPVLLLDESTSALDGVVQAAIQTAIDQLVGVTLVVVAHRLATLQTMDRIVVLDGGRIVDEGTFVSLAARGGLFTEMLASQRTEAA